MTQQQRELVHSILSDAPFDLGGDAATQRPLLEQMLTAQPLPTTCARTDRARRRARRLRRLRRRQPLGVLLHLHGGGFVVGSARGSLGLAASLARRTGLSVVVGRLPAGARAPVPRRG